MGLWIKLVALAIVGILGTIAARRMANAAKASIPDDECVSCGSREVQVQSAGAYVCLACGYEGGSGRAAIQRDALAERYASLSPEARREAVTDHVRTAARILSDDDGTAALGGAAQMVMGSRELSRDEGFDATRSTLADDLCAAASELELAGTIAGGEVVLSNGLAVDAKGVARSLLEVQDKLLASVEMVKTGAEAGDYLKAILAGVPAVAPPRR